MNDGNKLEQDSLDDDNSTIQSNRNSVRENAIFFVWFTLQQAGLQVLAAKKV